MSKVVMFVMHVEGETPTSSPFEIALDDPEEIRQVFIAWCKKQIDCDFDMDFDEYCVSRGLNCKQHRVDCELHVYSDEIDRC